MTTNSYVDGARYSAQAILDAEFSSRILARSHTYYVDSEYQYVTEDFKVPYFYASREQWNDPDDEEIERIEAAQEDFGKSLAKLLGYDPRSGVYYVEDKDGTILAEYHVYGSRHDGLKQVQIRAYSSVSNEHANAYLHEKLDDFLEQEPVEEPESEHFVWMDFYYRGPRGASSDNRRIYVNPWEETRRNYNTKCVGALEKLMDKETIPEQAGKLILLHGKPGTGKTSLIRSLAYKWKDWAKFEYIVDAEMFLGDAAYMTQVIMEDTDKYRIIVLEDCGGLIKEYAQQATLGMARLLNLADGILGQGQRIAFVITTNEPMSKLEPAVTRPGRCLAEIHVDSFPENEASKWLGYRVDEPMTLAEMYAETNKEVAALTADEDSDDKSTGHYL